MDANEIMQRFAVAEGDRRRFESVFDDAIRLTMPARARFSHVDPKTAMDDIFDETGANAVAEFVSRMQAGLIPPFTDFMRLEASSLVEPNDRAAVNRDLEEIGEYAFEEIWESNFAQETLTRGRRRRTDQRNLPICSKWPERAGPDGLSHFDHPDGGGAAGIE
jgi:Bacteriophage head to tail connecting protein